ncbi:hypothetical protein RGQ29_029138 [Quercus rubra]|uniref:Secreted protein n=1 Tax=Quercus rubra TaxID=3512 RepID=A0AAN7INM4_QUERU|nr:hypothetical protein RGQ29_029138 [Quercus rubra]
MVLGLYCLDCITRALCFLFASLNEECLVGFYFKKQGITSMCFYGSCPSQVSKCTWGFYVSNLWSRGTTIGLLPSCCCQRLHSFLNARESWWLCISL